MCYWAGDNLKFARQHAKEYSQIGVAASLSVLFHAPLFGLFEVEENTLEENNSEQTVVPAGISSKIFIYGIAIAAATGIYAGQMCIRDSICMTIALTGIPISVKAADSSGSMSTEMETNSELFITLEENKDYRWNVNDNAEKNSVVHLDSSEGNNCRFRLDHIENEWYGIKHIKVDVYKRQE